MDLSSSKTIRLEHFETQDPDLYPEPKNSGYAEEKPYLEESPSSHNGGFFPSVCRPIQNIWQYFKESSFCLPFIPILVLRIAYKNTEGKRIKHTKIQMRNVNECLLFRVFITVYIFASYVSTDCLLYSDEKHAVYLMRLIFCLLQKGPLQEI
jgi:hypothetical protein